MGSQARDLGFDSTRAVAQRSLVGTRKGVWKEWVWRDAGPEMRAAESVEQVLGAEVTIKTRANTDIVVTVYVLSSLRSLPPHKRPKTIPIIQVGILRHGVVT